MSIRNRTLTEIVEQSSEKARHKPRWKVPSSDEIRAIRKKTSLSQAQFADMYGLNLDCIKSWETGRSVPEQAGCLLLGMIDFDPERALEFFNAVETRQVIQAVQVNRGSA